MWRRRRERTLALLLATLLLAGLAGCEGGGDSAAGGAPFRNLGKRADSDFGGPRPAPVR